MAYSTVIVGAERRRRWSEDQKLALVEAAFAPGAKVAEVARRAEVCTSLLYRWRRSLGGGGFAPVVIEDMRAAAGVSTDPALVVEFESGRRVLIGSGAPGGLVEVVLRALR